MGIHRAIFSFLAGPALAAGIIAGPDVTMARAQDREESFKNLHVLPEGISRRELNRAMLGNLRGLGLPRRQNQGCLFCHVGDMEQPSRDWDYASDEKATKRKARVMMAMVAEINNRHLAELDDRVAPDLRVTCYTCHAGRTDPRPLPAVLMASYEVGGIDSAITRYHALRARYFGGDAYDFRVGVLAGLATQFANNGSYDDALALAATNAEVFPDDPRARGTWILVGLERTLQEEGVPSALAEYDRVKTGEYAAIVTAGMLDALGWRLSRRDRHDDAIEVFRKNFAEYPDQYVPNESLADALNIAGDRDTAIRMFEDWLRRNPDHAMARRRLTNLRGS